MRILIGCRTVVIALSLLFLSSFALAAKQPVQEATVAHYEGPVRDWYGGGCAYHPDERHKHSFIGVHGCWRNRVVLKTSTETLNLQDHCAVPWKFKQGETVEFQRDKKYPNKVYVYNHVYQVEDEESVEPQANPAAPSQANSVGTVTTSNQPVPSKTVNTTIVVTPQGTTSSGLSGQQPSPRREAASSPDVSPPQVKEPSSGSLGVKGANWEDGGMRGVQIVDVSENGSAQLAGLRKGDVITQVNGKDVRSVRELATVLASMEAGTRVNIVYLIKTNLWWAPKKAVAILAKPEPE